MGQNCAACADFLARQCWEPSFPRIVTLQPLYNVDVVANTKLDAIKAAAAAAIQLDNELRFPKGDELQACLTSLSLSDGTSTSNCGWCCLCERLILADAQR